MELAYYQHSAVRCFLKSLPRNVSTILELGSDVEAKVVRALAAATGAEVIGINPSSEFPKLPEEATLPAKVRLLREDGRSIPLADASVDAVFTVATIEHVIGVERFYAEVLRVLKPGGILHADFAPIWSSYNGHHTYAVSGRKEARYWKAGRNPIPDFAHLIWTPTEMRDFLLAGPCDDSLVDPIIQWIYHDSGVNRLFLEDHMRALVGSGLTCQRLRLKPGVTPDEPSEAQLDAKYGSKVRFDVAGVEATMRKCCTASQRAITNSHRVLNAMAIAVEDGARSFAPVLRRSRWIRHRLHRRHFARNA